MTHRSAQRGVTLPELLVALLIFAMISAAGVSALRLAVEGREQLDRSDADLREWSVARLIIRQDLAQVAARVVRDEFGRRRIAAFVGGADGSARTGSDEDEVLIGFVRRGWANPNDAAPRSELQYVEYVLANDDIVRRTRPYLDDAQRQPAFERVLFHNVQETKISFLGGEASGALQWSEAWPVPGAGSFAPRAVRLAFETRRLGAVEQLFWIGDIANLDAAGAP